MLVNCFEEKRMKEDFLAVIAANKGRQAKARELNQRAGQDLFKVFNLAELVSFVAECLGGARRQAEITQPEGLLLPELSQAEVARVERENPLQIELCGQGFQVDYNNNPPRVFLGGEITPDGLWRKLPDSGVCLPGGRQVSISLGYYGSGVSDTNIQQLKEKVRNLLNRKQWDVWANGVKPEIVLPDPNSESSEVAPLAEATYGTCAVTGTPLTAFGAAVVNGSHYYSTDPHFVGKWFQSRDGAEAERAKSVEKLFALKRELAEQKILAEARVRAEAVKAEAGVLYGNHSGVIASELRDRLYGLFHDYLPSSLDDLRKWTVESTATLTEVKQVASEDEARRNRPEIREVRIDRRGQYRKPELNGRRIDSREFFRFTPNWFWDNLLALVDEHGRGLAAFAIFRGEDPLMLAMGRQELELLTPKVERALKELGSSPTDEAKETFWRKLEGFRPKAKSHPPVSVRQEEVRRPIPAAPKPSNRQERGNSFGLGAEVWGKLDELGLK